MTDISFHSKNIKIVNNVTLNNKNEVMIQQSEKYLHCISDVLPQNGRYFVIDLNILAGNYSILYHLHEKHNNRIIYIMESDLNALNENAKLFYEQRMDMYEILKDECILEIYKSRDTLVTKYQIINAYLDDCIVVDMEYVQKIDDMIVQDNLKYNFTQNEKYFNDVECLKDNENINLIPGRLTLTNTSSGYFVYEDKKIAVELEEHSLFQHGDKLIVEENVLGKTTLKECDFIRHNKYKIRVQVGTVILSEKKECVIKSLDERFNLFHLKCDEFNHYLNKKVLFVIKSVTDIEIIKIVGDNGIYDDEIKGILEHHNINYYAKEKLPYEGNIEVESDWPVIKRNESIFEYLENNNSKISEGVDLSDKLVLSIDPEGCLDIDDAMHIEEYDGYVELGIHIADVVSYLKHNRLENNLKDTNLEDNSKDNAYLDNLSNNKIFQDALYKATTVYMPNFRIDMIPQELSTNICSLRENKRSKTVSVIFKIKENVIVESKFMNTIVENKKAFTYEEAEEELVEHFNSASKETFSGSCFLPSLIYAHFFTAKLRKDRIDNNALELNVTNNNNVSNANNNNIKNNNNNIKNNNLIVDTHSLIEELMLIANISVANKIYQYNKSHALLRKHPKVGEIIVEDEKYKIEDGRDIKRVMDRIINSNTNNLIDETFDSGKKVKTTENIPLQKYLKQQIVRNLHQAYYFISGKETDFTHFGIAADIYTHFTSPIRRIADVLVHSMLKEIIKYESKKKVTIEKEKRFNIKLQKYAKIINKTNVDWINNRYTQAKYASNSGKNLEIAWKYLSEGGTHVESHVFDGLVVRKNKKKMVYVEELDVTGEIEHGDKNLIVNKVVKVKFTSDFKTYCIDRTFRFETTHE